MKTHVAVAMKTAVERCWRYVRGLARLHSAPVSLSKSQALPGPTSTSRYSLFSSVVPIPSGCPPDWATLLRQANNRFVSGELFRSLAIIPESGGYIVAHIIQDGAASGQHLLAIYPESFGD